MLEDLEALGSAFVDALSEIASEVPLLGQDTKGTGSPHRKAGSDLSGELESDCGAAAGRLQESFRGLLSIVLLSAQDRTLLQLKQ